MSIPPTFYRRNFYRAFATFSFSLFCGEMKKRSSKYVGAAVVAAAHNKLSVSTHDYHGWGGEVEVRRGEQQLAPFFVTPLSLPARVVNGGKRREKKQHPFSLPARIERRRNSSRDAAAFFKSLSPILPRTAEASHHRRHRSFAIERKREEGD